MKTTVVAWVLGASAVAAPPITVEMLSDRLDRHEVEIQGMRSDIERLQSRLAALPHDFEAIAPNITSDIPRHDGTNFYFRVEEIIPVSQDAAIKNVEAKRKAIADLRKTKDQVQGPGQSKVRERSRLLGEIARLEIELDRLEQQVKLPLVQLFSRDAEGRFIRCDLTPDASRAASKLLIGDIVCGRGNRKMATASEITLEVFAVSKIRAE